MSEQLMWFKSSFSDTSGGNCLEVALDWRKSSHSAGTDGDPHTVHIRDSKRPDSAPHLTVPPSAWTAFVAYARAL
ncbi:DUF397 domain-containing protein [Streptomyces sp. HNM0574]|uniref:DUF397 domain-containing protein n=1 Tax=Streptomyces sp. HNM0574 TaxID=2714954 RepID=UPI00146D1A30|nr:DUF397 domain-containing protein [Streptomyces sp. HNM0574]NLU67032.1 DUF397 domain-containing protein [Streptomyces sp. HNM0574]